MLLRLIAASALVSLVSLPASAESLYRPGECLRGPGFDRLRETHDLIVRGSDHAQRQHSVYLSQDGYALVIGRVVWVGQEAGFCISHVLDNVRYKGRPWSRTLW